MIAFVLSGGGSRGALQGGAILALLERGIRPDLIVGTSVGAINGAALAALPGMAGIERVAERWRTVTRDDIFPGNSAQVAWRLVSRQPSLYPNHALRRFVLSLLPPGIRKFKDLPTPLLVTATSMSTGRLTLFGDDPEEHLVDALMASAAIPPYLPPWRYRDEYYMDGGVVANLPVSVALERGATTIYAIEIGHDLPTVPPEPTLRHTIALSIQSMLRHQVSREREIVALARREGVEVHYLPLLHYSGLPHENFDHSETLFQLGYQSLSSYLAHGVLPEAVPIPPRPVEHADLSVRLRRVVRRVQPPAVTLPSFSRPSLHRLRRTLPFRQ